ncbi:MAG TPA: hypothetical protein VKA65_13975, partial [Acidimicrobiales bacterium]|nr:hypothetical protein [Acidimicrobiales bacterium]
AAGGALVPRRPTTSCVAAGRRVAARLGREGKSLSRRALVERLRSDEGLAVGNQRAGIVLAPTPRRGGRAPPRRDACHAGTRGRSRSRR